MDSVAGRAATAATSAAVPSSCHASTTSSFEAKYRKNVRLDTPAGVGSAQPVQLRGVKKMCRPATRAQERLAVTADCLERVDGEIEEFGFKDLI